MSNSPPASRPKRRWRFTLSTLLATVTIIAVGFWIYDRYLKWRREAAVRDLVAAVEDSAPLFNTYDLTWEQDECISKRIDESLAAIERFGGAKAAVRELEKRLEDGRISHWIIVWHIFVGRLEAPATPVLMRKMVDHLATKETAETALPFLSRLLWHKEVMERVKQSLRQDPRPIVRRNLIRALDQSWEAHSGRSFDSSGYLIALRDTSEKIRFAAARSLAMVDPKHAKPAIPILLSAMHTTDDEWRPIWAARALAAIDPTMYARVAPQLENLAGDSPDFLGSQAALAIGCFGPAAKSAIPVLLNRFRKLPADQEVIKALVMIGAPAGDTRVEDALIGFAQDKAEQFAWERGQVVRALGEFAKASKRSLDVLINALDDKHHEVRAMAAAALAEVGPVARPAVPALRRALKDEHYLVRFHAGEAIKEINKPAGVK